MREAEKPVRGLQKNMVYPTHRGVALWQVVGVDPTRG